MDDINSSQNKNIYEEVEEVISMATVSFTKEFSINKQETINKLERNIDKVKPLHINSVDTISKMKRNEDKLLSMLRSKA